MKLNHSMPLLALVGPVVASLLLSSCSSSSDSKKTQLSYEYSVNGCSTGKKSFDSLNKYCDALRDDSTNNGCARGLRMKAFKDKCDGSFFQSLAESNLNNSKPEELADAEPTQPREEQKIERSADEPSKQNPVILTARTRNFLSPKSTTSGDDMMTVINAELDVVPFIADGEFKLQSLDFMRAESVRIIEPDLGQCELTLKQFSNLSDDYTLSFVLIGLDPNEEEKSECRIRLQALSWAGFTVHFENVPTKASDGRILESVIMEVN